MKTITSNLLFLCVLGGLSMPVFAKPAIVDGMRGTVEKRLPNALDWEAITLGEKLPEGTTVRTADNSEVELQTLRGHHFHVKSDTVLELTSLQDDETKTRLEKGSVLSQVKHLKSHETFAIQTPTAVCAVRGTEFETTASEQGTMVAVYKGLVGVSAMGTGSEMGVRAGQMTSVHNGMIETPR